MGFFRRKAQHQPAAAAAKASTPASDGIHIIGDDLSPEERIAAQAAMFMAMFEDAEGVALAYDRASVDLADELLHTFFEASTALPAQVQEMVASFVFEVARAEFGGRYVTVNAENPVALVVGEPSAAVLVLAYEKTKLRSVNGPEDSLGFFYDGIAPLVAEGKTATLT
ncbi:hypothetical protein [Lysinibacter cavernae]|uniref:DUF3806 domain-containing protein n=1 Tax=Lysinibacter cavernae TaxID=1640652 RepID=A0A7X5R0R5_9MICO|nr:hypothetical protein [Lysinibacter cavernae]NIH53473.1 hypothetical protein [Lysinibacter cavernae]